MDKSMQKPALICFHPSGKYLYSTSYCRKQENNLDLIQKSGPKIIQIDYEFNAPKTSKSLYSSYPVQVYFLDDYELLNETELLNRTQAGYFHKNEPFYPLISKESYSKNLSRIANLIGQGHFYQINYTIPFQTTYQGDALGIFHHYHSRIKGDFHALLPGDDYSIISFSPELFLAKKGNELITRPIKGTGQDPQILLESEKEKAELSMIVDLLRNDLNSVATCSWAKVTKHREIMPLGHLIHTYSEIKAKSSLPITTILERMLPGGSISGCPKKEACLTINQIEEYQRKAYTGIIGWVDDNQALLSIAIRTFITTKQNKIFYHSGGGIVFDSKAEKEYEELLLKASLI